MSDSKMKKLVILVPRIKSSNVNDIINNQIKNILLKLRNKSELKVIWVTFQPSKIKNTIETFIKKSILQ